MDFSTLLWMILIVFCINSADGSDNESLQHSIPCKEGWYLYGEKCYKIFGLSKGLSWKQASVKCSVEGGHLATIQSKDLNEFITAFLLLNAKTNAWIGLHDREKESNFMWDDGSNLNYSNWDDKEPSTIGSLSNQEDCVEMRTRNSKLKMGTWNDETCEHEEPYLCQLDKNNEVLSADPRFCSIEEGGGWKYLNSCYHIVPEEKSWEDAEKHCQRNYSGHLVAILDISVETFLNYLWSNYNKTFWIGIRMRDHPLQKWTSGFYVNYKRWDHEQKHFIEGTCGATTNEKLWTVEACFRKFPFICETLTNSVIIGEKYLQQWHCPDLSKEWIDFDGEFCYLFETKKAFSWYEANYECGRKGGTLASIHSEMESYILHHHVVNTQERIFIGIHRNLSKKEEFEWADGSKLDYLNWNAGEPNSVKEECGELWTESMKWNDIPCDVRKGYICSTRKLPPNETEIITTSASENISCSMPPNETEITASAPKNISCSNGVLARPLVLIIICIAQSVFLIGITVYQSRKFCKRRCSIFKRKDFVTSDPVSLHQLSSEGILQPEEFNCQI